MPTKQNNSFSNVIHWLHSLYSRFCVSSKSANLQYHVHNEWTIESESFATVLSLKSGCRYLSKEIYRNYPRRDRLSHQEQQQRDHLLFSFLAIFFSTALVSVWRMTHQSDQFQWTIVVSKTICQLFVGLTHPSDYQLFIPFILTYWIGYMILLLHECTAVQCLLIGWRHILADVVSVESSPHRQWDGEIW